MVDRRDYDDQLLLGAHPQGHSAETKRIGDLLFELHRENGVPVDLVVVIADDPFTFHYNEPRLMPFDEHVQGTLELLNGAASNPEGLRSYVKSMKPSKAVTETFDSMIDWSRRHRQAIMEAAQGERGVSGWVWALGGAAAAGAIGWFISRK